MTLTRAQFFTLLTLAMPVLAFGGLYVFAAWSSAFGREPYYQGDIEAEAAVTVAFTLLVIGLPVCLTLAVHNVHPSSEWGREMRTTALFLLMIIMILFGACALCYTIFEGPARISITALNLPFALGMAFLLHKEQGGTFDKQLLKTSSVAILAGVGTVLLLFLIAVGLRPIGLSAVTIVVSYGIFYGLPALVLFLLVSNLALMFIAKVTGARQLAIGFCPYMNVDRWEELPSEEAEAQRHLMHGLPRNARAEAAVRFKGQALVKLEYRDADGARWIWMSGVPQRPWPRFMFGLFLRGSNRPEVGVQPRVYASTDCNWAPMTEPEGREALERLGAADLPSPWLAWRCRDCSSIKINALNTKGEDIVLLKEDPDDLRWVGGLAFVFAQTPVLVSQSPR